MSARKQVTRTIDGDALTVVTTELEYFEAEDLKFTIGAAVFGGSDGFAGVARYLSGGKLAELLPRLLAGTDVVFKGDGRKYSLGGGRATISEAFTGRAKYMPAVLRIVLEANYADFFDGLALAGLKVPEEIRALFSSETSIPSTSVTG